MADVIILGGGIIGCSTAFELAGRGHKVRIIEARSAPFQGSSKAGFGSLTPYSDPFFSDDVALFAERSVARYKQHVLPALEEVSGNKIDFVELGLLHIFDNLLDFQKYKDRASSKKYLRGKCDFLDREQISELEPSVSPLAVQGIMYPEPWVDLEALFGGFQSFIGASDFITVSYSARVTRIVARDAGVSLFTVDGASFECDYLVVATGLNEFELTGLRLPLIKWIRGEGVLASFIPARQIVQRHIYMGDGFITPRSNGDLLLGATYNYCDPVLDADVESTMGSARVESVTHILENACRLVPALLDAHVKRTWTGWRPATSDQIPVVGIHPDHNRVVVALGFIGLGTTMAANVGSAIADVLDGKPTDIPLAMRPSREMAWGIL